MCKSLILFLFLTMCLISTQKRGFRYRVLAQHSPKNKTAILFLQASLIKIDEEMMIFRRESYFALIPSYLVKVILCIFSFIKQYIGYIIQKGRNTNNGAKGRIHIDTYTWVLINKYNTWKPIMHYEFIFILLNIFRNKVENVNKLLC